MPIYRLTAMSGPLSASTFRFKVGDIVYVNHRVEEQLMDFPNEYLLITATNIDKGGPYYNTINVENGECQEWTRAYIDHETTILVA